MKRITFLALMLAAGIFGQAQTLTLSCENFSGSPGTTNNRNYDIANCWAFGGVTYSTSPKIDGNYSTISGSATNPSPTSFWIKTPWLKPGTGKVYLKTRLSAANGTTRMLTLAYMPYDPTSLSGSKEGTRVDFFTHNFTVSNTNIIEIDQSMPAAIAGSNQPFKIMVMMYGTGGSSKILTDSWSVSGTYWADPSNSCLPQSVIVDTDNDGVQDADDAYPNDATRAYNNWYPAAGYGTLMFEDLWPATGDYDFNDLVLDYRYNLVTNAANKVVEMKANVVTRAIGASFKNGFALQFDNLSPAKITAVTGQKFHAAPWLNNAANGTENGQTFANVVVFDDATQVLPSPGGSGTNVYPQNARVAPDTTALTISFTTATGQTVSIADISINPYIIIDQVRGKEVHLPNSVPSSKAESSYFGQMQDDTKPAEGKYYKTANNLPWALNVTTSIPYSHSTNDFITAYLKFSDWAQSNGTLYTDWYLNNSGYRDAGKLFIP